MKVLKIVGGVNCTTITYQKDGVITTVPFLGVVKTESEALTILNRGYKYSFPSDNR